MLDVEGVVGATPRLECEARRDGRSTAHADDERVHVETVVDHTLRAGPEVGGVHRGVNRACRKRESQDATLASVTGLHLARTLALCGACDWQFSACKWQISKLLLMIISMLLLPHAHAAAGCPAVPSAGAPWRRPSTALSGPPPYRPMFSAISRPRRIIL